MKLATKAPEIEVVEKGASSPVATPSAAPVPLPNEDVLLVMKCASTTAAQVRSSSLCCAFGCSAVWTAGISIPIWLLASALCNACPFPCTAYKTVHRICSKLTTVLPPLPQYKREWADTEVVLTYVFF